MKTKCETEKAESHPRQKNALQYLLQSSSSTDFQLPRR